jgi:hypothetical protein
MEPMIFERDSRVFLVSPVAPFTPAQSEVEELAFARALLDAAPNPNIKWLRGQYVEADNPNLNNALWTEGELAISSLTPNLMPVTVMHDPRTAVGLIADTKLLTRAKDNVPRSRIDSTLGIWAHRFPEIAAEIDANYASGDLMQSMECLPTHYDCTACGKRFPKLPGGAEKAQWCACLRGETAQKGARALGNVTFTGTGLIFGHRGATGALPTAHLEVLQEEVAEFHEKARKDGSHTPRPKRGNRRMEIEDREYQQLIADRAERDRLKEELATAKTEAAKVPDLERKVEETETAKVAAEQERDSLKTEKETLEEQARVQTLAKERLGALGSDFLGKFGEFAKGKLEEQAGKLDDAAWEDYLKEREEMAGVARDAGEKGGAAPSGSGGGSGDGTFTREEVARSGAGGGGGGTSTTPSAPSDTKRRSVVAGLVRKPEPATK